MIGFRDQIVILLERKPKPELEIKTPKIYMKTVFAYIRVSTHKQGSEGASLPEQRDSIQRFCDRSNLHIQRWFEEEESAAKRGRPLFTEMLKLAKKGKAEGLVFHKIDRSTRNLGEWAEVSSLPEIGIDVHYSHEPVDLTTNHGRTAADVAAVFASAYIRNLREEVKKGINGRLKQGIYCFQAPVGYLNQGKGQLKTIDPIKGPMIKRIFEKYATGEHSYMEMLKYAKSQGLTGIRDTPISKNGLSFILNNPFYTGLIFIKKHGTAYPGRHEPLITTPTFDKVQNVLRGKTV
jgi:site-specific DNA recombinase